MDMNAAAREKVINLEELRAEYEKRISLRDEEIAILREQIRSLKHHLFGSKSEKLHPEITTQQPSLFELEQPADLEEEGDPGKEDEEKVTATRRKKPRGRKKLPDWLPRKQIVHDLSEEDKVCRCGCTKTHIGADRSEVLEKTPAQVHVIEHLRLKYACKNPDCPIAMEGEPGAVQIAPAPLRMIPKSMAGHSLLAHVLNAKFTDWLPFYRVEKQLRREHVLIPRQTMSRWAVKVAHAFKPMWALMLADVKKHPYLQIDETTVQVLNEPGRKNTTKSYMWGVP